MFLNGSILLFFSDYRAELYTRLVIEESKKQARKKRTKASRAASQGQQREVGSSWSFVSPRMYMESGGTKGFLRFLASTSFLQPMSHLFLRHLQANFDYSQLL